MCYGDFLNEIFKKPVFLNLGVSMFISRFSLMFFEEQISLATRIYLNAPILSASKTNRLCEIGKINNYFNFSNKIKLKLQENGKSQAITHGKYF